MLSKNYDKILLALSLLVLIGLSVLFFQRGEEIAGALHTDLPPVSNVYQYEMTPQEDVSLEFPVWQTPQPQSAGDAWVYDIFTPPYIFYNEAADEFVPRPPGPRDGEVAELEIEFIGFQEEPYRIQLTGYAGRDEDPLITFLDNETGEMILTRRNREVPEVDIEVRSFNVRREERNGVVTRVPEAVIFDRRTGEEVLLLEEETKYLDEPAIVVTTSEDPPRTINARPGEMFDIGEYSYLVEEYTVDPPEIIMIKYSPNRDEPRRATLRPGQRF